MARGRRAGTATCCVAALALSGAAAGAAPAGSRLLPAYAVEPFQSDLATYSIATTREGYVWLGAQGQVAQWDGRRLQSLGTRIPSASSSGHRLAIADDGTLWIALGLELYPPGAGPRQLPRPGAPRVRLMWSHDGRWNHFHGSGEVVAGPVNALAADRGGAWLGTLDGLVRFAGGRIERVTGLPAELEGVAVLALATSAGEELLVGTAQALARRRQGRWEVIPIGHRVQAIAPLPDGRVAIGTDAGLRLVGPAGVRSLTMADGLPADDVRAIAAGDDGTLWLGTSRGLAQVAPDASPGSVLGATIGLADGLPDDNVLALGRDRDGTLWVGTATGGVVTVSRRTLWNLGQREGLPGEATWAVLRAHDGRIWVATSGGLAVFDGDELRALRRGRELPQDAEPRALADAPDGAIWVATHGAGVLRVDPVTHAARAAATLPWRDAGALVFDAAGDLWVGSATDGRIARVRNGAVIATWSQREGACDAPVTNAAATPDGTVWFGSTDAGLTRIAGGAARCFTHRDGLPRDAIGALLVDGRARLWVGLRFDGGVARLHGDRFVAIDTDRGLPCDSVHALAADGAGGLWTGCGYGVAKLPLDALDDALARGGAVVSIAAASVLDGMRAQSCTAGSQPGAAIARDGSVWFATPLGVTVVRLEAAPAPPPPVPTIETLTLDGRDRDLDGPVEATGTAVSLSAELAAPASRSFRRVHLDHRLVGVDADWVASGEERTARYPQLGPGRYRLQVRATRDDGNTWIESGALELRVLAPLHRRPEFLAALALGLAALAFAAHRARVRTIAKAHEVVQQERVRIARELHDGLGQSLSAAGYLLKAAEQKLGDAGADVAGARAIVANTRAVLERSYDEARRSTWYLRDPEAAGRPLEHALRELVEAAIRGAGDGAPAIELVVEGQPEVDAAEVRRELPAIAHEAITNALRHAHARRIEVRLARSPDGLTLTVRDDGRGIGADVDLAAMRRHGHFGLLGIEERAARIGGAVRLGPAAGGGTEVRVAIPKTGPANATADRGNGIVPANRREA